LPVRGELDFDLVEWSVCDVEEACFEVVAVATEMAESCGEAGGYIVLLHRASTRFAQREGVN